MTLRNVLTALAGVFHHDVQAAEAPAERRGPNARMSTLLRKANGSQHFSQASIRQQTAQAMAAQHEKVA